MGIPWAISVELYLLQNGDAFFTFSYSETADAIKLNHLYILIANNVCSL